jgi:hypothetical protein
MGGRVVDRARLESVFTLIGNEGSNPSPSAGLIQIKDPWRDENHGSTGMPRSAARDCSEAIRQSPWHSQGIIPPHPLVFFEKMRHFSMVFSLALALGLLVPNLDAKPKSASNATPKATPDPRKDPQIQRILTDLRPAYPHLTAGEIVRTSNHDLRRMYEHLYHAQGLSLLECKQKASTVPLKEN